MKSRFYLSLLCSLMLASCNSGKNNNAAPTKSFSLYNKQSVTDWDDSGYYLATQGLVTRIASDIDLDNITAGKKNVLGYVDGKGIDARFGKDIDIVKVDKILYVVDTVNKALRKIDTSTADNIVSTIKLTSSTLDVRDILSSPQSIVANKSGELFVSDKARHVIFKIVPANNTAEISIFAGELDVRGAKNGLGQEALFNEPCGLLINDAGYIFVAGAGNDVIRMIAPNRQASILVGRVGVEGETDGRINNITLTDPEKIEFGEDQNSIIVYPEGKSLNKNSFIKYREILLDKTNPVPTVLEVHTINDLPVDDNENNVSHTKTNNTDASSGTNNQSINNSYDNLTAFNSVVDVSNYNPRSWGRFGSDINQYLSDPKEWGGVIVSARFYIGRLYSQVQTGIKEDPKTNTRDEESTGNYGWDHWAWCKAGEYNTIDELKKDLQARMNADSNYNNTWNPADPNKSAYAYVSKTVTAPVYQSFMAEIKCDTSKIIYLVRPVNGSNVCPKIKSQTGDYFSPENKIGSVKAQDSDDFYILNKDLCNDINGKLFVNYDKNQK